MTRLKSDIVYIHKLKKSFVNKITTPNISGIPCFLFRIFIESICVILLFSQNTLKSVI